jgi:transposase InsO family protein
LKAFDKIMTRTGGVPKRIHVDEGTEFLNKTMYAYLKKKGINIFWTYSPLKSVIIERFIRTLFGKIERSLTLNKTRKFVDKLPDFEKIYNSYHRSIKMAPIQVTKENEKQAFANLYPDTVPMDYTRPKFKIGDKVLAAKTKKTFEKGYYCKLS